MTFIVCFVTVHNGFTVHNAQFPLLRSELRFATVWTYVGNRGRNRRVYLVMRNLSWANVSERIRSGRLKKFSNMFKNKK